MKFQLKPAAPKAKAPKAKAPAPLSDVEFVARVSAIDDFLRDNLQDFDVVDERVEVAESFKLLNLKIRNGMIDDSSLEAFAKATPGLKEIYTDLPSFKAKVAEQAASVEGFLDGMFGDANTGLIGAIIAFARNNLPAVKADIDVCKQKLALTSDNQIAERTKQKLIRVRSKYLPSLPVFNAAVKALTGALDVVASNPKSSFDKITAKLSGTMFAPEGGKPKGQQDTDWKYIGVRLLPSIASVIGPVGTAAKVAERFWYEKSQPVGERGWSTKPAFVNGLKSMEGLIASLAKAIGAVGRLKDISEGAEAAHFCKWAEKEIVYLGRGLCTAIRKLYADGVVRFVSNRFIH